jgi:hypothetical protein
VSVGSISVCLVPYDYGGVLAAVQYGPCGYIDDERAASAAGDGRGGAVGPCDGDLVSGLGGCADTIVGAYSSLYGLSDTRAAGGGASAEMQSGCSGGDGVDGESCACGLSALVELVVESAGQPQTHTLVGVDGTAMKAGVWVGTAGPAAGPWGSRNAIGCSVRTGGTGGSSGLYRVGGRGESVSERGTPGHGTFDFHAAVGFGRDLADDGSHWFPHGVESDIVVRYTHVGDTVPDDSVILCSEWHEWYVAGQWVGGAGAVSCGVPAGQSIAWFGGIRAYGLAGHSSGPACGAKGTASGVVTDVLVRVQPCGCGRGDGG